MSKSKIILSDEGVQALLKAPEMASLLTGIAYAAANQLGKGYEISLRTGPTRVNAEVAAVTRRAKKDNAKNNTILKAIKNVKVV